jgi:type III pantothenate kinase
VPLLIIDAGTAITHDVVLPPGHFVGGNISPGLTTRFRALHDYTRRLPLISERDEVPDLGVTTEEAILSGVVRGIVYEMNGYIETMHTKHPHAAVFLTGGHAPYFDRRLKCRTFASENLVWLGLNRIIEYNEDK